MTFSASAKRQILKPAASTSSVLNGPGHSSIRPAKVSVNDLNSPFIACSLKDSN